jgi:cytochrome c-type biogenesis protein CcmH
VKRLIIALLFAFLPVTAALAVNPDEILDDPALEARARDISTELRCLVCQNQSIDDSDADLARDLRVLVRERLQAGDSDKEVLDFVVARYGEFVLLSPPMSARNMLLWGTPLIVLLIGGIVVMLLYRNRAGNAPAGGLTDDEQLRLSKILADGEDRDL